MATYIGYYRINEGFERESAEQAREAGEAVLSPTMRRKVIDIRDKLPASIRIMGSYAPLGAMTKTYPGVWIVGTDDPDELGFVSNWYRGFLDFERVPVTAVGATVQDTTATLEANQARR